MLGRGNTVLPGRNTAGCSNFWGYLGCQQNATLSGLGPLRELDFDHFDLLLLCTLGKAFGAEITVFIATAKIARTDIPDEIAAMPGVVFAYPTFARVMGKVT